MKTLRFLGSVALALVAGLGAASANAAEAFPARPIRIFVGYGAAGGADSVARTYAEKLQGLLNTPVIVENRPGAFEQLAAQAVLSAPPDGHTLWLGTAGALTMGPGVRTDIPYDILKSFAHVARIAEVDAVLAVKSGLPVNSMADLIAYAKANPNKLFYGSAGVGAGNHLLAEYIFNATGTAMTHVPYKSDADVVRELAGGAVDFGIPISTLAVPMVKDGRIKALGVTGSQRLRTLPDVPSMGEPGGVESLRTMGVYSIYGLLGHAGMPATTTQTLSDAFNKAARMPDVVQRLEGMNFRATTSTPAELRQYLEAEVQKWRDLGKTLKISFQ